MTKLIQQLDEARYDLGDKNLERLLRFFNKDEVTYSPTGTPRDGYAIKSGYSAKMTDNVALWFDNFSIDREPVAYDEDEEPRQTVIIERTGDYMGNFNIDYFLKNVSVYKLNQVF